MRYETKVSVVTSRCRYKPTPGTLDGFNQVDSQAQLITEIQGIGITPN